MANDPRSSRFFALYAQHQFALYRYVLMLLPHHADAEDVMQEAAKLLWEKFDRYDASEPFLPWAKKFAYYEVLKHRRASGKRRQLFSDEMIETLAEEAAADDELLLAQREALSGCMASLDAGERELVEQRYAGDVSIADLAAASDRTPNALYIVLHRVRAKLIACVDHKLAEGGWQ